MEHNTILITVCGDGGCGKSSLIHRLVRDEFTSEYDPTIEDSYAITRKVNGLTYNIHICDTAGQEEYRSLFSRPTLQADAFLLVYDITQAHTLDSLSHFTTLIRKEAEERQYRTSGSGMSAVPPVKMVVGNKCDLDERRQVKSTTGQLWAHDNRCAFVETSARNQINVEETFAAIIRAVISARVTHRTTTPKLASSTSPSLTSSTTAPSTSRSNSTSTRPARPHPKATYSTMPPIARTPRSPQSPRSPRAPQSIRSSPPQSYSHSQSQSTITTPNATHPAFRSPILTTSASPVSAPLQSSLLPLNATTLAYLNTDPHPTPASQSQGYVANPTRALTPINASELSEKRTLAGGGALPRRGYVSADAKGRSRSKGGKYGGKKGGRRSEDGAGGGRGWRRVRGDSGQYSSNWSHGHGQGQGYYYSYSPQQQPSWSEKEPADLHLHDTAPSRTSGLGLWSATSRQMKRRSTLQSYGSGSGSGSGTRSSGFTGGGSGSGRSLLDGPGVVGSGMKRKRRDSDDGGRFGGGGGGGGLSRLFAGLRCF